MFNKWTYMRYIMRRIQKNLCRKHAMTTKNTLGKAAAVVLMAALVSACSSNAAKEEAAAQAAAEQAAAEQAAAAEAAEQRAKEKEKAMQMAEKREEKRRLMDAASAAGSVFYFDYDSSSLSDDARAAIDAHVALMMADSGNVRLEGHTDERGTREYNLALGERRANAVRDYMVASGVPAYRIETISYGEENPVAYGSGESNWMKNRRVEIK
jgi:peptidoglycan-associated lipoprotein